MEKLRYGVIKKQCHTISRAAGLDFDVLALVPVIVVLKIDRSQAPSTPPVTSQMNLTLNGGVKLSP